MTTSLGSSLREISDQDLLYKLKRLAVKSRQLEAELLVHIGEVDARRLYLQEACSSMFVYCTKVLYFAESAAYHRITAARIVRRYPEVLERLKAGEIHLAGISLLAPHLTLENHQELLARAKHGSKREIEELVAELRPKPAARALVRKLPAAPSGLPAQPERPEPAPKVEAPPRPPHTTSAGRPRPVPLGADRFACTARPQAARKAKTPPSRYIPAEIRRAVVQRDGGRCQYASPTGQRCGSRDFLEFHHLEPWACSRRHSASEIVMMCRAHNQYEGERVYGREHMERCGSCNSPRGELC